MGNIAEVPWVICASKLIGGLVSVNAANAKEVEIAIFLPNSKAIAVGLYPHSIAFKVCLSSRASAFVKRNAAVWFEPPKTTSRVSQLI